MNREALKRNALISTGIVLLVLIAIHGAEESWRRVQREVIRLGAPGTKISSLIYSFSIAPDKEADYKIAVKVLEKRGSWFQSDFSGRIYVLSARRKELENLVRGEQIFARPSPGWEIFDKSWRAYDAYVSFDKSIRLRRARKGELENALAHFHFIRKASVNIAVEKAHGTSVGSRSLASITVYVSDKGRRLSRDRIQAIKAVAVHMIPGLRAKNISIMNQFGDVQDLDYGTRVSRLD